MTIIWGASATAGQSVQIRSAQIPTFRTGSEKWSTPQASTTAGRMPALYSQSSQITFGFEEFGI
jgi:hypothetical protein